MNKPYQCPICEIERPLMQICPSCSEYLEAPPVADVEVYSCKACGWSDSFPVTRERVPLLRGTCSCNRETGQRGRQFLAEAA